MRLSNIFRIDKIKLISDDLILVIHRLYLDSLFPKRAALDW